jgi:branched-chain amino acid transport system ATP-binding protein
VLSPPGDEQTSTPARNAHVEPLMNEVSGPGREALSLSGIGVSFGGVTALSDVSVRVRDKTVFGLIGPNGAGKTTLFNVVCGFVQPSTGVMHWDGKEIRRHRPNRLAGMGIARTLQGLGLFDNLTVRENVMVGADHADRGRFASALLGLPSSARRERRIAAAADATLADLGLTKVADANPANLSYGIRKRVALARALISEPRLLLLDEPASGLSQAEMDALAGIITSLRDRCAVMLVEHHMDLVMAVTDEIAVLDFGRLIAHGSPDEIRTNDAVTTAYLGEALDDASTVEEA